MGGGGQRERKQGSEKGGHLGFAPVKPTRLITVNLCAESKKGLALARIKSNRDIFAFLAASCAARNRATRCSGVSAPDDGPADSEWVGFLGPASPGPGANPEGGALAPPEPSLEEACGVVAVNRVADEAVRSPLLAAMVGVVGLFQCPERVLHGRRRIWALTSKAEREKSRGVVGLLPGPSSAKKG